METMRETALNLINMNILTDAQIAQASGLTEVEVEVKALRTEARHLARWGWSARLTSLQQRDLRSAVWHHGRQ